MGKVISVRLKILDSGLGLRVKKRRFKRGYSPHYVKSCGIKSSDK